MRSVLGTSSEIALLITVAHRIVPPGREAAVLRIDGVEAHTHRHKRGNGGFLRHSSPVPPTLSELSSDAGKSPERLGHYEILLPIATGTVARVYLARPTASAGFDRYVVVKVAVDALRDDCAFTKGVIDAARLGANLRHANVVPIYDVGEDDRRAFVVVEYVPGESLLGLRRRAAEMGMPLPQRVVLRMVVDALHGLHAFHEHESEEGGPRGLVVGDVSPRNVLIGTDGVTRLCELGLTQAALQSSTMRAEVQRARRRYMAPDEKRGEPIDRRGDIWALGAIAWELLTGREIDEDVAELPPLRSVAAHPDEISEPLERVIERAVRVDRDLRIGTAAELAKDIAAGCTLAEASEVAEHVNRLAGTDLARRRAELAQMRKQQRSVPPETRTEPGMGAPVPASTEELPPLQAVPVQPLAVRDAPLTLLALKVDLMAVGDRASESLLGPSREAPPPESEPAVFASPVQVGSPSTLGEYASRLGEYASRLGEYAAWLRGAVRSLRAGRWTKAEKRASAAVAGGCALLVVLAVVGSRCSRASAPAGMAIGASSGAHGDGRAMLRIHADGPIASVAVGERVIAPAPAPTIEIELLEPERSKPVRVVVTSTDGRTATATAENGTQNVDVVFGAVAALPPPPPPPSAQHPAAAPREKRTWQRRHKR
jgi:eukaryotic-like serine/threonine-protein kinase